MPTVSPWFQWFLMLSCFPALLWFSYSTLLLYETSPVSDIIPFLFKGLDLEQYWSLLRDAVWLWGCVLGKLPDREEKNHWGRWSPQWLLKVQLLCVFICTEERWDCQHWWFFRIHFLKATGSILPNVACGVYQYLVTKSEPFWLSSVWSPGLFIPFSVPSWLLPEVPWCDLERFFFNFLSCLCH